MSLAEPSVIAHLLKRTGFGATPERIQELAIMGWENAVTVVVDQAAPPIVSNNLPFKNIYLQSEDTDFSLLLAAELKRLAAPDIGLGDRMLWFWHGLITSAQSKVDIPPLLLRQHQLMARHALGSFRQMLLEITTDVAMLVYLDGDGSTGDAPNENFGRELMELFTLGRGAYQQTDVKAAARGLAGWSVNGFPGNDGQSFNPDQIVSAFDPTSAYTSPQTYLGQTTVFDVPTIIETILSQDACAKYIATKLFQYFVHPNPDSQSVASLANTFRNANYEIKPLLSALFRHPDFQNRKARGSRARFPLEVLLAATTAFSTPVDTFDFESYFDATGQVPFDPPNVAGWPLGNRWLSASHTLARARLGLTAFDLPSSNDSVKAISAATDPVGETFKRAALYEVSLKTRKQLTQAAKAINDAETRARTLLSLAVASPEFALA